jgi:photosystem II stability/assembly factor-like uncharacterized protein
MSNVHPFIRLALVALCIVTGSARAADAYWPTWTGSSIVGLGAATNADRSVILVPAAESLPAQRSTDGGKTFQAIAAMADTEYFVAVPGSAATFYAVGPHPHVDISPPPVLYRSDDAGLTWRKVEGSLQLPDGFIDGIKAGTDPGVLLANIYAPTICFTGLCGYGAFDPYRSDDGGITWKPIAAGLTGIAASTETGVGVLLAPALSTAGRVLYAATADGIFRSDDGGSSWSRKFTATVWRLAADSRDSSTAYAWVGTDAKRMIVTRDGGLNWSEEPAPDIFIPAITSPSYLPQIIADPIDEGRVFLVAYGGATYESTDRGSHWKRVAGASALDADTAIGIAANGSSRYLLSTSGRRLTQLEIHPDSYYLASDLWWNPQDSGRGLTITQHDHGQTFVAWFAYDSQGRQAWRVMPEPVWLDSKTLSGALYQTTGPAYFNGAFDPAHVSVKTAGSATLIFQDDGHATFTWQLVDGTSGSTPIERETYAPATSVRLSDLADLWWNAAESGWGVAINMQRGKMFAAWYVYDANGNPIWVTLPDSITTTSPPFSTSSYIAFSGDIYVTTGPPSTGPYDASKVTATRVGNATLTFTDPANGSLNYTAFGQSGTRSITRQPF